jgi:hypothetical protein
MKARLITNPEITGDTSRFNVASLSEVVMCFDDGSADSMFPSDIEVFVNQEWIPLDIAFKDELVEISDDNTIFYERK